MLPGIKSKRNTKRNQTVLPVVPAEPFIFASSRTTPTNERCSRYDMRECVLKRTRSSSKPKHENRKEINYANLNDGLDEEGVCSPPRKKAGRKGPGSYPSDERLRSYSVQNDRVHKKLKLTSEKEKELDLESIMDDSDTLQDIVLNQPGTSVTHADTNKTSDLESPLNQLTSGTSDVIISENELSGVTTPPMGMNMPNNIETAAVTAPIENITDYRLFCGGSDNTNNDGLTNLSESGEHVPDANENGNTDTEPNKIIGNVVNEPDTER